MKERKGYVLQPIGEAKYKLVFGRQRRLFLDGKFKTCYRMKI